MKRTTQKLIAVYKEEKRGKATLVMERTDYNSKNTLAEDLRGNGYSVVAVFNEKDVETFKKKPEYLYTRKDDLLHNALQNL